MEYNYGLTQQENYSLKMLGLSELEYLEYSYKSLKTRKTCKLEKFEYVDITCNQEQSMGLHGLVSWNEGTVCFEQIVFSNNEKIEFHGYTNKNIVFVSCVFFSSIQFLEDPKSITMDSCIVKNTYSTNNRSINTISLNSCMCNELFLRCTTAKEISINLCKIINFSIMDLQTENGLFINNTINNIYYVDSKIDNIVFDYNQLVYLKSLFSIRNIKRTIGMPRKENAESAISTLEFIQNLHLLKNNPVISTKIDYVKSTYIKHGLLNNVILKAYGNFLLPFRTVLTSFILIALFAILYYINEHGIQIQQTIDIYYYLSLSFEAFLGTTKDIVCNHYRLLSYIERLLGFFSMTVFTITLAKKYLK